MNRRLLIGLGLLLIVALGIAAYQFIPQPDTRPVQTVKGYVGGEKAGFLQDTRVQQILRDKYRLQIVMNAQHPYQCENSFPPPRCAA